MVRAILEPSSGRLVIFGQYLSAVLRNVNLGYNAACDMANEVISYLEMCAREGTSLQRGMNFGLGGDHSVVLMSVRPNAPYRDRFEDNGTTLIYEGHDEPRSAAVSQPKAVDQPERTAYGTLTQNGRFHRAAQEHKNGQRPPERVRVYEKMRQGIWSYKRRQDRLGVPLLRDLPADNTWEHEVGAGVPQFVEGMLGTALPSFAAA